MISFKQFFQEENLPTNCSVDIQNQKVRDSVNNQLDLLTEPKFLTPYVAFQKISAFLATLHIHPGKIVLEGEHGVEYWPIHQFGEVIDFTDETSKDVEYYFYFEYAATETGWFTIFSSIVNSEELEELLDDIEDEINKEESQENDV